MAGPVRFLREYHNDFYDDDFPDEDSLNVWAAHSDFTDIPHVTFENHTGFIQDLDAFNKAFRFLQLGSMNVRKYHRLVEEVYIKGDGSGGTISWGPRPLDLRLLPQKPEQAVQLMTLPPEVQYKIYGMALLQVKIDADKTASPLCPLLYVNPVLHYSLSRDEYLRDVKLIEINIMTILTETTFSDYDNLRKLIRNMFDYKIPTYSHFGTLADRCRDTVHSGTSKLQFNLQFNVREAVMLDKLCISILPFVMETSYFSRNTPVAIGIFSGHAGTMVPGATHRIPLHALRSRVLEALTATIDALKSNFRCFSYVWINGRGEVVGSRVDKIPYNDLEKPKFASKIVELGPMCPYEIENWGIHDLDWEYRSPDTKWQNRDGYSHWYYDQFFPFTQSPNETLNYLQWVFDPDSVPSNQRKLTFISQYFNGNGTHAS